MSTYLPLTDAAFHGLLFSCDSENKETTESWNHRGLISGSEQIVNNDWMSSDVNMQIQNGKTGDVSVV